MTSLSRKGVLGCGVALSALTIATGALAQQRAFDIPAQSATKAVPEFARQAGVQIVAGGAELRGLETRSIKGQLDVRPALAQLLEGTGLAIESDDGAVITLGRATQGPQGGSAGGDVDALIVTAQKREENIQDVPIAISAFSQEDLTRSQIAGGPDLITQVPNMTFTKTNFTSYTIQIRGIGTQAISATTDPAVAVAFNNTPFITNRFFEQEFYDLQRVEVLRGPQGTLYGRNATAGVVNIISAKPKFTYEAKASGDISNFNSTRVEGMINLPLVEDKVALRVAGAWTKRDGYATNQLTGNPIDGRDLWSTRVSLRFAPTDNIDANLIWEHFEEDDDRLRSGKQLCKKHVVTDMFIPAINGFPDRTYHIPNYPGTLNDPGPSTVSSMQTTFSQGCLRESLYSPDSFQTPNGQSIPYYYPLGAIGLPIALPDPYVSLVQSPDLRVIESTIDPDYRAKSDLGELQVSFDLTDSLTLSSETAYSADFVYSMQDFNRFNTAPGAWRTTDGGAPELIARGILTPDGYFCDPQLGCSNRLVAVDIATGKTTQFSQEFRLASDFDGPFNFSLGANFLRADNTIKYYVFINSLSMNAAIKFFGGFPRPDYVPNVSDNSICLRGAKPGDPNSVYAVADCVYIDPNPIGSLNDNGHNYFLSKNPYKLISYAAFGEVYYNVLENLKVTAGFRWTVDKKEAPRIPSWTLASDSFGYPVAEVIEQEWREPSGRFTVDWKPDLPFTDETLLYGSYARGYKAGGANPPGFVRVFYFDGTIANQQAEASATRPKTFDPEFLDAFELGAKNTLADGRVTVNLAAFYYDYRDYQISEIVDRSAFNRNFDATVWGVELEADWRVLENLRLGLKGGYEDTKIADGEKAVDLMDRTAGTPGWSVVRPFPTFASSCILPTWLYFPTNNGGSPFNLGAVNGGAVGGCEVAYIQGLDPATHSEYQPNPPPSAFNYAPGAWVAGTYPGWDPKTAPNNGEGFDKQLGGNELPNAPHWTWTITGDYTLPLGNDWLATLHTDLHWQAESWWRVFQDHEFAKLDEYFTMNLAAIFTSEERGWNIMAYIKNVTDETAITGAFLNSDDTGLTTNVFLTEPRLYGIRVTKAWTGEPWWTGANSDHPAGEPYPLTIEVSGQIQRQDAPYEALMPPSAPVFSEGLNIFDDAQNQDLDWGDGRELKVTWRSGGPWSITGSVRYGRTNNGLTRLRAEEDSSPVNCMIPSASPYASYFCFPDSPFYYDGKYLLTAINHADATGRSQEDHTIIDFSVGRDVGLGFLGAGRSRVGFGLRRVQFGSQSWATADGIPDWSLPDGWYLYDNTSSHRYQTSLETKREFEGAGPTLSWEAARRLFGNEDVGHVDLDWSVTGGVVFGKQNTSLSGSETASYWKGLYSLGHALLFNHIPEDDDIETRDLTFAPRSNTASVPMLDLSLGLSYEIQRVRIGAGYRWERYFDVLDAGFESEKSYDRTIDGPYFKFAVGFGG